MAHANGNSTDPVTLAAELQREPHRFGFFEALRLLECAHRDKPRIGHSTRPNDDPVRLGQEPSPAFAPSTLASFAPGRNGGAPRLAVRFFGLFGPNGPLPLHLTEFARDRIRNNKDPTFSRFSDLFHHRMLTLFYRAWASGQPTVQFDRPESDRFALYVGSLIGLGQPSLRGRDAMPDSAKLFHAGRLSAQSRNAEGLHAILSNFFELPFEVEEFVGAWLDIPASSRCYLGVSPETGTLGTTATIGAQVWDCAHKFRIHCGPLNRSEYLHLLPGGERHDALLALVENYIGHELAWDLHLILEQAEVPRLQLGMERLGWTTWLCADPFDGDAGDVVLSLMSESSQ